MGWAPYSARSPKSHKGAPGGTKNPLKILEKKKNVPKAIPRMGPRPPKLGANVPTEPQSAKTQKKIVKIAIEIP